MKSNKRANEVSITPNFDCVSWNSMAFATLQLHLHSWILEPAVVWFGARQGVSKKGEVSSPACAWHAFISQLNLASAESVVGFPRRVSPKIRFISTPSRSFRKGRYSPPWFKSQLLFYPTLFLPLLFSVFNSYVGPYWTLLFYPQ